MARKKRVPKSKPKQDPKRKTKKKPERVSQPKRVQEPDSLKNRTEYSCKMDISLTVDFEGEISKKDLSKYLKSEIVNSIKSGMTLLSNSHGLECNNVLVQPLQVECVVNDTSTIEDDEDSW